MSFHDLALKIGSQLIEARLQKLADAPTFNAQGVLVPANTDAAAAAPLATSAAQQKDRSAKVHPPRIITVR